MATALARRTTYRTPSYYSTLARARQAGGALRRAGSAARSRARAGSGADLATSAIVVAGGAAGGFAQRYVPSIAGIDPRIVLGVGAILGGIYGVKGKAGSALTLAGAGMVAAAVSEMTAPDPVSEEE